MKRKKARKRAKQKHLDGMEPPRVQAIEDAAEDYVQKRDLRVSCLADEIEAKQKLLDLMQDNKLTNYTFDNYEVRVAVKEQQNVKVKTIKLNDDDDED